MIMHSEIQRKGEAMVVAYFEELSRH